MIDQPLRFILASSSPRRKELIKYLCLPFEIMPSTLEEVIDPSLSAKELVQGLAQQKAFDIFDQLTTTEAAAETLIVLGADTIVALDGKFLGKPSDEQDAHVMLNKLSGRCHEVHTGIAIVLGHKQEKAKLFLDGETSKVTFRTLADDEIEFYIKTKEPMDKAGSYALQGIGSAFVEKIEGCFTNIIGLPIPKVVALLREIGVPVLGRAQR